jgi:hypothetical protein
MKKEMRALAVAVLVCAMTAGMAMTAFGAQWVKDRYGWWYDMGGGNYPVEQWKKIDNKWYYFNESGYIRYGWVPDGGKWYYCWSDGAMCANRWIDGLYYVGSDGAMLTNTTTPDGYKVGADGKWVKSGSSTASSGTTGSGSTASGSAGGGALVGGGDYDDDPMSDSYWEDFTVSGAKVTVANGHYVITFPSAWSGKFEVDGWADGKGGGGYGFLPKGVRDKGDYILMLLFVDGFGNTDPWGSDMFPKVGTWEYGNIWTQFDTGVNFDYEDPQVAAAYGTLRSALGGNEWDYHHYYTIKRVD